MKTLQKQVLTLLVCVIFLIGMLPAYSVIAEDISLDYATDCVFVVMKPGYSALTDSWDATDFGINAAEITDLTSVGETATATLCGSENYRQILKIELNDQSAAGVENAIAILQEDERVQSVSLNYYYETFLSPNDPYYNGTMANMNTIFELIGADDAWDITTGSQDVTVGIIDSGIADHVDFGDNLSTGYDYYNENDVTTDDPTDHGTRVAGIVGAVGNNGVGVVGVNSSVTLVPLQAHWVDVFLSTEAIAKSVIYAYLMDIDIINCSFGSLRADPVLYRAMQVYDGLIVCAAGNNGENIDVSTPIYPACFDLDNIITVANTTVLDQLNPTSNYGVETVDLAAPGTNIYSTVVGGYGIESGTSLSAPFVTGTAALLLSYNSNLTATDLKSIILGSVDPVESLNGKGATGGRLNVYKALQNSLEAPYVRNITSMVTFPANTTVKTMQATINYNANKYSFHSITFDDAIRTNIDYSTSVPGTISLNVVFSEETNLTGDMIRCNFTTQQKFALAANDITITITEAHGNNDQAVTVTPALQTVLLGDMDLNNTIDSVDYDIAYSIVSGSTTGTALQNFIADVNCDNECTVRDALKISQYINKRIYTFW